jgi:hypothetical protein
LYRDDFDAANEVMEVAESVAKRGKLAAVLQRLAQIRKVLDERKIAHAEVVVATSALQADPDNADAQTTVGKYRCFYRREWDLGLPALAHGSDIKLKVLAQIDIESPANATAQADLADQWCEVAENMHSPWVKTSLLLRAAYWYQRALADLPNGLLKSRVQKRLTDIAAVTGDDSLKAFVARSPNSLSQE